VLAFHVSVQALPIEAPLEQQEPAGGGQTRPGPRPDPAGNRIGVWRTKLWYSGSSPALEPSSSSRIPPRRNALKSIYATSASSAGIRLSSAAVVRERDRYRATPQTEAPADGRRRPPRLAKRAVLCLTRAVSHSHAFGGARFLPQSYIWVQARINSPEVL